MKPDEQNLIPFPLDHDENAGALPDVSPDAELNRALRSWPSPNLPTNLDARVLESYREYRENMPRPARLHRWISRALVVVAVLTGILAAIWLVADRQPLTAMELLQESGRSDAMVLGEPTAAFHRVCAYEERRVADGAVLERRRIESWHRGGTRIRARRVFNGAGEIVAGEWIEGNGSRRSYAKAGIVDAAPLVSQRPPISAAPLDDDRFWIEPSAEAFLALLPPGAVEQLTLMELGSEQLVVAYQSNERDAVLETAQIVLRKFDRHAIEQSVRVRQNGESREFYVAEVSFESVAASAISNSFFEPDMPEAIRSAPIDTRPARKPAPRMSDEELIDLEVALLDRLDRAAALVGQEATVTRRAEGSLQVRALVEGEERKNALLDAMTGLPPTAMVDLDIRTFAEAAPSSSRRPNDRAIVRDVAVSGQIAARDELIRFLSRNGDTGGNGTVDEAVRRFASEALSHSREAVLHAGTARDLLTRFSSAQIAAMDASARERWRNLVTTHLREVGRESALLRQLLEPVFFTSVDKDVESRDASPSDGGLAAERLFRSAISHDEIVRAAFALSSRRGGERDIARIEFLRSLRDLENLVTTITKEL